jgi:ribosome-associated toxin RatA of RatAB toxin-antitoxin module
MASVRQVEILEDLGTSCISAWEVEFRDGLLRWTERDTFLRERLRIEFAQIDGDLEAFAGSWEVTPAQEGSTVTFAAVFDLGIPSLAAFLEPVAQAALEENVARMFRGLFGDDCAIAVHRSDIAIGRPSPEGQQHMACIEGVL